MANMTVNQRTQFDRVDLSVPTTGVQVRSRRGLAIYSALALAALGALTYATITLIDGWAQAIVFGFILLTAVGAMIAVSPARKA
jgi:hypothetical protein